MPGVKIGLVQKYIGGTKTTPQLAKIGGKTWLKQKAAAEEAVADLASEMLELQAMRTARPGIAFSPDSQWQHEFDASFPYQETPDQISAIESIKRDMQRPRPMDRLLCGDVGFGKTEVAMRAAFKAVDNGYQVAVLVPTTILAEQHFRTFAERMSEFPFTIAKLSRFCTPQEEREAVAGLKSGKVDIVIGTHRIASSRCRVPQPRPGDHRRGAAIRRRCEGAAQNVSRHGRRAHAQRHADSADAAHVAGGRARYLQPRPLRRRTARPWKRASSAGTMSRSSTPSCAS